MGCPFRDCTPDPSFGRGITATHEYTSQVTAEESVLEEAMDNLREAAQRIRATQNLMHARGMTEEVNYRELLTRLSIRRLP